MTRSERVILDWTIPVALLVAMSIPFWTGDLDLQVARTFYEPGAGWVHGGEPVWRLLHHYGVIPAWILSLGALGVFGASFARPGLRRHRRAAAFLVLAMMVGPGIVVNTVYKDRWGRPRPRDLAEFGGQREHVKPFVKSPHEYGKSFPSGHAAAGFYLLTPYFLLRRHTRRRALLVLATGIGYGSVMGIARMAQGAHFLSDILWALGFIYLTALGLFYLLRLDRLDEAHVDAGEGQH